MQVNCPFDQFIFLFNSLPLQTFATLIITKRHIQVFYFQHSETGIGFLGHVDQLLSQDVIKDIILLIMTIVMCNNLYKTEQQS